MCQPPAKVARRIRESETWVAGCTEQGTFSIGKSSTLGPHVVIVVCGTCLSASSGKVSI